MKNEHFPDKVIVIDLCHNTAMVKLLKELKKYVCFTSYVYTYTLKSDF